MTARLREWLVRLAAVVRPRRDDRDLEDELRAHLLLAEDDAGRRDGGGRRDSGGARSTDAREVALRAGGIDQALEALRDQRGWPWLADVGRDLRQAARLFTRSPGVAGLAVLSLTIGLTLGLTAYRVVNAYLVRAFPYPAAERLHAVELAAPGQSVPPGLDIIDWPRLDDVIEHRMAWDLDVFYLLGGEYPEPATGAWVTEGFVQGLGLQARLGRVLDASDFGPSGPTHVLISHRLWISRYQADPGIVGRQIHAYVSDRPDEPEVLTIAGVLPAEFWHLNTYTDVIAPLRVPAYPYMVTLRPGVAPEVAAGRIESLIRGSLASLPDQWRVTLPGAQARYVLAIRPIVGAVAAAAILVLLIAVANVAVLLLVRAITRQHEMAVRLALGSSRLRLARLLAVEALVLAVASTALGLAASSAATAAIAPALESQLGRRLPGGASALGLDSSVLLVAIGAALVGTAVLTLVPLAGASLPRLTTGLVSGGRGQTTGRAARHLRSALVAAEVAGALALLVGSALMIDSTRRLVAEDTGLRTDIVAASLSLRQQSYPDAASRAAFYDRVLQRMAGRPGATPAALGGTWPLQPARAQTLTRTGATARSVPAAVTAVSAGYFDALGIPLRDGASFAAEDRPGGLPVIVVSESLAGRLWPGERAVGQTVRIGDGANYQVTGVAADVRQIPAEGPRVLMDTDLLDAYVPLLQNAERFAYLYVPARAFRPATTAESALRIEVAAIDRDAAVTAPRTLAAALDELRARPRRLAWMLSVFAVFATVLALVGVYGVIAYAVRQRQKEIGIRIAVGADRRAVTRLFLREGGPLVAAGLAGGVAGALALGEALGSQLFGVRPVEPYLLLAAGAALGLCGGLALWWPARSAAALDPTTVLRGD